MATGRRFCRFSARPERNPTGISQIPESGFCLNVFLLVTRGEDPPRVLMGRLDPKAPWDHLGGLDAERVAAHSGGWMLPSSQLVFGEAPEEAVARLQRELLNGLSVTWSPPKILSEVYRPRRHPEIGDHWDLGFVYVGRSESAVPPKNPAWSELEFVDPSRAPPGGFARSHEDVLAFAGFGPRP